MGKPWTAAEDKILIQKSKSVPIKDLKKFFKNRSESAIRNRLFKLQVKSSSSLTVTKQPTMAPVFTPVRSGARADLQGEFFRSGWEANFARYLKHKKIKWEYEPRVYVFKDISRGPVAYTPDFYIPNYFGEEIIVEVKGRVMSGTYSKFKYFRDQYPEDFAKLRGVCQKNTKADRLFKKLNIPILMYYSDLRNEYKSVIKNWEGK